MTTFTLLVDRRPAAPELIDAVERIEVDSSLEEASAFRVSFAVRRTDLGDWTILQDDAFGSLQPVSIAIALGSAAPATLINGYVADRMVAYADAAGRSTLHVSGLDATSLMNLEERVQAWADMGDDVIAAQLFEGYGILPAPGLPLQPVLADPDGTTMQRGTDIRFLRMLARRNGFDCYVQPDPLLGADVGHFEPRRLGGLPDAVLSVSFGQETNVSGFTVRDDLAAPAAAEAIGLDVKTGADQAVSAVQGEHALGRTGTLERESQRALVRPAGLALARTAELGRAVQALVDRSTWSVTAQGTVGADVGPLRPGGLVNVRGCGRQYSGTYLVTRVRHLIERDRYEQHFEARRNAVGLTGAELFMDLP